MKRFASLLLCSLLTFVGRHGLAEATGAGLAATNQAGPGFDYPESNLLTVFLESKAFAFSKQEVGCRVRFVPAGHRVSSNDLVMVGGVAVHGATSQGLPKRSCTLRLAESAPLLGLRKSSHWLLNAAYIDRSLMRHKLAYDLYLSLSSSHSPRYAVGSRFVEVYLNGKYSGVYLLMERVDRQLLGFAPYQGAESSHACLYKAVDHGADFGSHGHNGFVQKEPDPSVRNYWEPLEDFNRFVVSSTAEQFFHPQTGIASRLDVEDAIDFHLLVLMTCNWDGIDKNFYFGRNRIEPAASPARFFFVPWDYDGTFGRNWDASPMPETEWLSSHLFARLLGSKDYREKFIARWNQLRTRQFATKTIHDMIDANVQALGPAAQRNFARWPTKNGGYPDQLTFEQDIAQMKAWVEKRGRWLDQEINQNLRQHGR